jgi:CMP-N-acetylneuraminic acid synthetase
MLNYGISIIEKNSMRELKALIGHKPSFFELDSFQSIDINTVDEFTIAETLYKNNLISGLISY